MGFSGAPRLMIVSDLDNTMVFFSSLVAGILWNVVVKRSSLNCQSSIMKESLCYAGFRRWLGLMAFRVHCEIL